MKTFDEDFFLKHGILIHDNFFSNDQCQQLIDIFLKYQQFGFTHDRQQVDKVTKIQKDDASLFLAELMHSPIVQVEEVSVFWFCELIKQFDKKFWDVSYKKYVERFGILNIHDPHQLTPHKIQQTSPSQGYHVWHCENMGPTSSSRVLTYILYLNEVEGGETEFLYQSARVAPKTGRLILFPCNFLHTHRGNPPLDGLKYVMTGWVVYK